MISQHEGPPLILGLNPTTGYYAFSGAVTSASELGDIVVEPTNPFRSVVIGDVTPGHFIGIAELDGCGNISNPNFGIFSDFNLPGGGSIPLSGINNRGISFSPTSNLLWSDGDSFEPGLETLFSFPPGGGSQTVLFAGGAIANDVNFIAIAADEVGDIYVADRDGPAIVKYTAATLTTASPVGVSLPQTSLLNNTKDMVHDGKGSLFVTGGEPDHHIWKVNAATGATAVFTSNFGPFLGGAPLSATWGITIDNHGDLWVVLQDGSDPTHAGVVQIDGQTGQVVQFFAVPASLTVDGQHVAPGSLWGIAVYGEELPAVRKHCELFPTISTAVDAATGSVVWSSPGLTDSFKSCSGPYGGTNVLAHGDVQAAQAVTVNSGTIHGARIANRPSGITPMPVPAGLASSGDLTVNAKVTLASGDYLFHNVNVNSGGSIIGSGGLVRIWFSSLNVSSRITAADGLPANLWLFGVDGANVNVNSGATITGVIDAPGSAVSLNSSSKVFGSVIGSKINGNGGVVHFDEVLGGATCP